MKTNCWLTCIAWTRRKRKSRKPYPRETLGSCWVAVDAARSPSSSAIPFPHFLAASASLSEPSLAITRSHRLCAPTPNLVPNTIGTFLILFVAFPPLPWHGATPAASEGGRNRFSQQAKGSRPRTKRKPFGEAIRDFHLYDSRTSLHLFRSHARAVAERSGARLVVGPPRIRPRQ